MKPTELDAFTLAYVECALWSTNDESNDAGGNPLDDNYTVFDIAPETLEAMARDCAAFQRDNEADLHACYGVMGPYGARPGSPENAGHDFWLTRNGHGAGFWDGDWTEPQAERLTAASKVYGEVSLYIGDDGRIHS